MSDVGGLKGKRTDDRWQRTKMGQEGTFYTLYTFGPKAGGGERCQNNQMANDSPGADRGGDHFDQK